MYKKTYEYGKSSFNPEKQDYNDVVENFFSENDIAGLYSGFNQYLARHMDNPEEAGQFFTGVFVSNISTGIQDASTAYQEQQKKEQSGWDAFWSGVKIVGAVVAGAACTVATAGTAAAICIGAAAYVVINETMNLGESLYTMNTGKDLDLQSELLQGMGMSEESANSVSKFMDGASNVAFVTAASIATAGTYSMLAMGTQYTFASTGAVLSNLYVNVATTFPAIIQPTSVMLANPYIAPMAIATGFGAYSTYVGTSACLQNGCTTGEWAMVGANAIMTVVNGKMTYSAYTATNNYLNAPAAPTHGNDLTSTKPQHVYEIYDKNSGGTYKYGISGQTLNQNGTSPRANTQVNQLNSNLGSPTYDSKILYNNIPTRIDALKLEQQLVNDYYNLNARAPQGNILPKPNP